MNRVEAAINEGRCVLAIGGRALKNPDIVTELRRRPISVVALDSDSSDAKPVDASSLSPALDNKGGIIVLIAPEGAADAKGLAEIGKALQAGSNKPKLFVAAKAFNPFALPMSMRLLKMEQIKTRALDFIAALPLSVAETVESAEPQPQTLTIGSANHAPPKKKEKEKILAPRALFIGQDENLQTLQTMLSEEAGPIVVVGTPGIGRRWVVEKAIEKSEMTRLPDFTIGGGVGADTFLARMAAAGKEAGEEGLHEVLELAKRKPSSMPSPAELTQSIMQIAQSDAMTGKVLVIHHLHRLLDRRDSSFYREGRLELFLKTVLLSTTKLQIVFISEKLPMFYREGEASSLRVLALEGIAGNKLSELFNAWQTPEFPKEHFGNITERTHGHPLYARGIAISIREGDDIEDLVERPKFLKAANITDIEPLRKHIRKRLSKLKKKRMEGLCALALFREPQPVETLQELGINRRERLTLLSLGHLEQTPHDNNRGYYVHPMVLEHLDTRRVYDFDTMEDVGRQFLEDAKTIERKSPQKALALRQEANRLFIESRRAKACVELPYPNTDPLLEELKGIMLRKNPRLDIAQTRISEAMKSAPKNTELLLAEADLRIREEQKHSEILAVYTRIANNCPTPEAIHHQVSFHLKHNSRGKAVTCLEHGIEVFPSNARLLRRLGGLYLWQNRLDLAGETLKKAADLEPMMPDTYSLLGEVYIRTGQDKWEEAEQVITEARRLAPDSPIHMARQADLLRSKAMIDADNKAKLLESANELLNEALKTNADSIRTLVLQATVLLDQEDGDLERVQWLLKKAGRRQPSAEMLTQRARLAIRKGDFERASKHLDKAYKREASYYPAYGVRGEMLFTQGHVFHALEAYKTARDRSPKTSPERTIYQQRVEQLKVIIESGAAAEMMKNIVIEEPITPESKTEPGPRREPGKTTVRRTRKGKIVDVSPSKENATKDKDGAEQTPVTASEEAPAEEAAEAPAEEAAEAPAEEAAEAPAEEAAEAPAEEAAEAPAEEAAAPAEEEEAPAEEAAEAPAEEAAEAPAEEEVTEVPAEEEEAPTTADGDVSEK